MKIYVDDEPYVLLSTNWQPSSALPVYFAPPPPSARPLDWHTRLPGTLLKAEVLCIKWSVLPPSVHPNGRRYTWEGAWADRFTSLDDLPVAPEWMLDRFGASSSSGHRVSGRSETATSDDTAQAMVTYGKWFGVSNRDLRISVLRDLLRQVSSMATLTAGERNPTLFRIASLCAAYRAHGLLVQVDLDRLLADIESACLVNGHDTDHPGDRERILARFDLTAPASPKETRTS